MNTADTVPQTAARAAAEWWAAQISAPTFRVVGDRPGERDFKSDFFETWATAKAAEHPVTDDAVRVFTDLLETAIAADLQTESRRAAKADPSWSPCVVLCVDYGPDPILGDPAKAAGISLSRFPIKTRAVVYLDHVTASLGYGSRERLIWSTPEWEQARPECSDWKLTGDGWKAHPDLLVCGRPRFHDGDCGDWTPDPTRCARCGQPQTAHHTPAAYLLDENRCMFKRPEGS